jgi:hypothetical protein
MFLDPDKLHEASPAQILKEAAAGRLGIDHRFLHALMDRPKETMRAIADWRGRDHDADAVDLELEIVAIVRALHAPEGIPAIVDAIQVAPDDIPDEVVEAIHSFGELAVEPLLHLYLELEDKQEESSEEIAFLLASLGVRDPRILGLLLERMEQDADQGSFLLGIYGDPATRPELEKVLSSLTDEQSALRSEIERAIESFSEQPETSHADEAYDIYAEYPETADPPVELLSEQERLEMLDHPNPSVRAEVARSFSTSELDPVSVKKLLQRAQSDSDIKVRVSAWTALTNETEQAEVLEAMLDGLRNPSTSPEERAGITVGLALEADRNEVRKAMEDLYAQPETRARALEAMWRSLHPSFRDYFEQHLYDTDVETRRSAIWGVGYFSVRSAVGRLRELFEDEELRPDALFAYALAIPADISRSRMKSLLARIENDAEALSEGEVELVKIALDERLAMIGKHPYFNAPD